MKKTFTFIFLLICLLAVAGCSDTPSSEEQGDFIHMVMVDGELYLDTGHTNTEARKCGTPDGQITSEVDAGEAPTKDNQSNFGRGYGYQYTLTDGVIEVHMNGQWHIFATEEAGEKLQLTDEKDAIAEIQEAETAYISFSIDPAAKTYKVKGEDVKKVIALLKPETWEKGSLQLELAAIEYVNFYKGNTKYFVAILDVGNNEVMFELYSNTNGEPNGDSCYYKTNAVGYKELMDGLRELTGD